jgi:hypothetical protein
MKQYTVTVRYTVETTYTVEAEHEEGAEAQAWNEVQKDPDHALSYGEWELVSVTTEAEGE